MAGSARHSGDWPSTSFLTLTLRLCAGLMSVLALVCWLWASTQPLVLEVDSGPGHDLRWWSGLVVAAAATVGLLTWFAGTVGGRLGLLTVTAVLVLLVAGGLAFGLVLAPDPNPIHPISSAVPYAIGGFAAAAATCLLTLGSGALSGGWAALNRRLPGR